MVVNGWTLFAHPLFLQQLETLTKDVEKLRRKDPAGYASRNATKRLIAIRKLVFEIIPQEPGRPEYSSSFDLLFRGTELVTGGQRLHRYEDYEAALAARGLAPSSFAHYLEAFRFGMPPHGGFAIGLERFLMQLLGAPNIRLTTLFPRDTHRLTP